MIGSSKQKNFKSSMRPGRGSRTPPGQAYLSVLHGHMICKYKPMTQELYYYSPAVPHKPRDRLLRQVCEENINKCMGRLVGEGWHIQSPETDVSMNGKLDHFRPGVGHNRGQKYSNKTQCKIYLLIQIAGPTNLPKGEYMKIIRRYNFSTHLVKASLITLNSAYIWAVPLLDPLEL